MLPVTQTRGDHGEREIPRETRFQVARAVTPRRPLLTIHAARPAGESNARRPADLRVETSVAAGRAFGADLDDRQGPPTGAWSLLSSKAAGSGPGAPRVPAADHVGRCRHRSDIPPRLGGAIVRFRASRGCPLLRCGLRGR